ncbi:unnamed protein product (macronuclear) [Paramecium tetraurelia]|uniref:Uncharacterized protein n=1 Tax=Paramecium tetraurelia TaxID=5888 RepID=A0EDB3_PARTE|nr:uncharacterized protein GSPATT00004149001 [Paramecium tetraurelia]CAK93280.1 unnamed protein product [Paramecium tetraurelia]|eukprot:XP_001460677.1 hypothetical protein (macronuclear) [Paramecium tetraurelia strain d4-2]
MQSILTQCECLDEEYKQLVMKIHDMLDNLSIVSLEFVNSKLEFLDKYSKTLKSSQIDARLHRNSQMRNLIEYIKMHKKTQVKSQAQSPPAKMAHHRPKYSFNEKAFSNLLYESMNQITQQKTQDNEAEMQCSKSQALKQKSLNTLQILIKKQKSDQRKGNEDMFKLLQKCMNLIGGNKHLFDEHDELQQEYQRIVKNNKHISSKVNLEMKSSKIKQNISQLMASQESFKSYLNSII